MITHDVGDRRKLSCEIRDEDGALADPDYLTFAVREPDGAVTVYRYLTDAELVRESTGRFYVYWDCALAGVHHYRFEATGAIMAAAQDTFHATASTVTVDTGS